MDFLFAGLEPPESIICWASGSCLDGDQRSQRPHRGDRYWNSGYLMLLGGSYLWRKDAYGVKRSFGTSPAGGQWAPASPVLLPRRFCEGTGKGGHFFWGEFDRTFSVHFCSWCLCTSFYRLIVKHGSHENRRVERKIIINHHLKTPNEIKWVFLAADFPVQPG